VNAGLAGRASTVELDDLRTDLNAGLNSRYDSTDLASQAQAEGGTNNDTLMTPLRTMQQIVAKLPTSVGATTEALAFSTFTIAVPSGVGFSGVTFIGCSETVVDSSTKQASGSVDGNFRRNIYQTAASALNRAAGFVLGNGSLRLTAPAAETVLIIGFGDTAYADGTIYGGLFDSNSIPAWTTVQPSAIPYSHIGFGCDEGDTEWQLMWRSGSGGTITKIATGIPRVRLAPMMIYIRPNDDASQVFVRLTRLSISTGRETGTPSKFEYTITTNISTGSSFTRGVARGTMGGTAGTPFQGQLLFGGIYGGRIPLLNYPSSAAEIIPANRAITGATSIIGTDVGAVVNFNSPSTASLAVPTDASMGFNSVTAPITVYIAGVGIPSFTANSGVTILGAPPSGLGQNSFLVLNPTGVANTWAYA
jgi:hypothetical protein